MLTLTRDMSYSVQKQAKAGRKQAENLQPHEVTETEQESEIILKLQFEEQKLKLALKKEL